MVVAAVLGHGHPPTNQLHENFVKLIAFQSTDNYDYENNYYNEDEEDYEYDTPPVKPTPRRQQKQKNAFEIPAFLKNQKQLGFTLLAVGFFLTFLGLMLFFEGNLLRLGNICLISGIPLAVGPNTVRKFLLDETRIQASIITCIGILLVFFGKPRIGILCEIFGLLNNFGNMFPMLFRLMKSMPIVGDVLSAFDSKSESKPNQRNQGSIPSDRRRRTYPEF